MHDCTDATTTIETEVVNWVEVTVVEPSTVAVTVVVEPSTVAVTVVVEPSTVSVTVVVEPESKKSLEKS